MQLALLMYSIAVLMAGSDNSSDRTNHTETLVPTLAAMISVSVVHRAVGFCSQLVQDTAPSANVAIMPVVESLFSLTPAKSTLLKHVPQNP